MKIRTSVQQFLKQNIANNLPHVPKKLKLVRVCTQVLGHLSSYIIIVMLE